MCLHCTQCITLCHLAPPSPNLIGWGSPPQPIKLWACMYAPLAQPVCPIFPAFYWLSISYNQIVSAAAPPCPPLPADWHWWKVWYQIRGRELGRSPRAEGERMSADECKQHDCDHKVIARSFKNAHAHKIHTKLMHIKVFCNLLQSSFWFFFETLISNMRYIWLNCKMLINFNIFVDLAIIFSASLKQ